MKIRNLLVAGLAMAVGSSSFAAYTARLWFENHTQLTSGAGQVNANPGDEIWVNFQFSRTNTTRPALWTILQVFIDLQSTTAMASADSDTWDTYVGGTAFAGTSNYPTKILFDTHDVGGIYNNATDPTDVTQTYLSTKGLYALIGVKGTAAPSSNINVTVFKFTATNAIGQEVHFGRRPPLDASGIWTQLIDQNNHLVDVARGVTETGASTYTYGNENWVRIVPEPGTFAAMATGLVGLLALRRRK